MSHEKASGLPPFFDNFPVDIHLRIYQEGNRYTAEVRSCGVKPQRIHIKLTRDDMKELNRELQDAVEEVSLNIRPEDVTTNADLLMLAQKGKLTFNMIFAEDGPREIIRRAIKLSSGTPGKNISLEISSNDFFVPWELLYDGPIDDGQVDISSFWGMHFVISRTLIQDNCPNSMVSPIMQASRPRVGLIVCEELPYVTRKEIPLFGALHKQKKISLSRLRSLDTNHHQRELEHIQSFLRRNLQIAHLACHACEENHILQSYLLVSDGFRITMQDFHLQEFTIRGNPLVILNACLTGINNPLHTSNWAALFWKRGARGVIATEFRVPDWFAANFAEELYARFLPGMPIGEALLTTRHYLWEHWCNPLGLAYALYSPPDIRIVNSRADSQHSPFVVQ